MKLGETQKFKTVKVIRPDGSNKPRPREERLKAIKAKRPRLGQG